MLTLLSGLGLSCVDYGLTYVPFSAFLCGWHNKALFISRLKLTQENLAFYQNLKIVFKSFKNIYLSSDQDICLAFTLLKYLSSNQDIFLLIIAKNRLPRSTLKHNF